MGTVEMTQQLAGSGRRVRDWLGDRILLVVTATASVVAVGAMILIAWRVLRGAYLAYSTFGLSFVWGEVWDTNKNIFGAAPGLYGTAVTSLIALVIATPLAIAIALFLTELAPNGVRTIIGTLVEMLAAIPSVVLGLRVILGLGRALGEAIAVTQVIGAGWAIRADLFGTGDTLASRIAGQYAGAITKLQTSALFYLAAILLVIGLVTNLFAQLIVRRFEFQRTGGS